MAGRTNHTFKEPCLHGCRRAQRSYPTLKVRKGSGEEIPLVQGKEQWLSFAGGSSVYSCHLLISSPSVRSLPFLSFIEPIFACSLGISNFFEEISSLSHSIVILLAIIKCDGDV